MKNVERFPNLYSGDLYFSEMMAKQYIKSLNPEFCKECGKKRKKIKSELIILPLLLDTAQHGVKRQ